MDYLIQAETAPYEEQIRQTERLYNTNKQNLSSDNDRALRELYVGRMIAERDLPSRLTAYGMNGGLTETSEMDLRNRYHRNRGLQEEGYQRNLADLTNTYQGDVGRLRAQIASIQARIAAEQMRREEEERRLAAARVSGGSGAVSSSSYSSSGKASYATAHDNMVEIMRNRGDAAGQQYIRELYQNGALANPNDYIRLNANFHSYVGKLGTV